MSAPYYSDPLVTLFAGDCLDVLPTLAECSVDAVVTDPPYGLGFMGKAWDSLPPAQDVAAECLRVLKPGGYLLAFGGSRTWHRLAAAVEDAGFEIRDSIAWLYGSGFPKSLDVSKALDRAAGAERQVVGLRSYGDGTTYANVRPAGGRSGGEMGNPAERQPSLETAPATDAAKQWAGWGTALKPAFEPIVVARKSLTGTVAANVLAHGTGALNIDACRVESSESWQGDESPSMCANGYGPDDADGWAGNWTKRSRSHAAGRWPTNVVLDESQAAALDEQTGVTTSRIGKPRGAGSGDGWGMTATGAEYADAGGASRFFPTFHYEAKAPTSERPSVDGVLHPTVKPLDLMRWLVRLVTPRGGTVLDPFLGSGTTAEACVIEGLRCIGIEREPSYLPLAVARLSKPIASVLDFGEASA